MVLLQITSSLTDPQHTFNRAHSRLRAVGERGSSTFVSHACRVLKHLELGAAANRVEPAMAVGSGESSGK